MEIGLFNCHALAYVYYVNKDINILSLYGKTCKLFPHKQNLIVVVVEFQPSFQSCLAIIGDHVHASKRYLIVLGIAILLL